MISIFILNIPFPATSGAKLCCQAKTDHRLGTRSVKPQMRLVKPHAVGTKLNGHFAPCFFHILHFAPS